MSNSDNADDNSTPFSTILSINPYAVLNISQNSTKDEIQKSYKTLSKSFHPDKQPPGKNRDIAQQYFVKFKASYDLLIDPVLRLSYDSHGVKAVTFLRQSPYTYKKIEELLAQVDEDDHDHDNVTCTGKEIVNQAKEVLSEAMQYNSFLAQTRLRKPQSSAHISLKCDSTHSAYLGEGIDENLLEVEETQVDMSVTKSPNVKTSLSFGGYGSVRGDGKASSGIKLSINHEPTKDTDVTIDLDVGATPSETKVNFGTSRVMSNQTYVATNLSASASNDIPPGLMFTSHRSMMEGKVSGAFMLGLALPNFQMQYGLLSVTSQYPDQPQYTAKFNSGMSRTPIELSVVKVIDKETNHTGYFSWGWGPGGIKLVARTSRFLSKYCTVGLGLTHDPYKGLSWLFQLRRGSMKLSVPVLMTTLVNPAYAMKSVYMTCVLGLVDQALGDFVRKEVDEAIVKTNSPENRALRKEEMLLEKEKAKRDAMQQIGLMEKPAEVKRRQEEENRGLVILSAVYSVAGGDSINVTTALMFWVVKGRLLLPSTTKSSMLGFYDVRHETPLVIESGYVNACWKVWEKLWHKDKKASIAPVETPNLRIRYRYQCNPYEITIADNEALSLPSSRAMQLGGFEVM